ncbi:hypothetical protein D3C75_1100820 [compost metagenome]
MNNWSLTHLERNVAFKQLPQREHIIIQPIHADKLDRSEFANHLGGRPKCTE